MTTTEKRMRAVELITEAHGILSTIPTMELDNEYMRIVEAAGRFIRSQPKIEATSYVPDMGLRAREAERYERAAHAVQSALAVGLGQGDDIFQAKHLRVGIDTGKADMGGLATLLIAKGVFTHEEYLTAVADSMEREAKMQQDHLSQRFGINIDTF